MGGILLNILQGTGKPPPPNKQGKAGFSGQTPGEHNKCCPRCQRNTTAGRSGSGKEFFGTGELI